MLVGFGLVVAVHVVTGLDPISRRLSEYVHEEGGFLMVAAFIAIGLGMIGLGLAIRTATGRLAPWVATLVGLAGVGMIVSGLYPTDPGPATISGLLHSRASGGATLALIGASILWSFRTPGRDRLLMGLSVAAALLGVVSVALHETGVSGLGQRSLWVVLLAWLLLAAVRLERV